MSDFLKILAMFGVLFILYLITPNTAINFALVILLIAIGYGMSNNKFTLPKE